MESPAQFLLAGALALMLAAATLWDLRTRTIPNVLNLGIALGAAVLWWAEGLALWPDVAARLTVAALVFLLFWGAFALGAMGGGDVKMIAALTLWVAPAAVLKLILIMSIAGGLLTLLMLARHRLSPSSAPPEVPYGVAIAFAGFWLLGEPFLNHFA